MEVTVSNIVIEGTECPIFMRAAGQQGPRKLHGRGAGARSWNNA